eukprot:1719999-Amphidinium_carterae.1
MAVAHCPYKTVTLLAQPMQGWCTTNTPVGRDCRRKPPKQQSTHAASVPDGWATFSCSFGIRTTTLLLAWAKQQRQAAVSINKKSLNYSDDSMSIRRYHLGHAKPITETHTATTQLNQKKAA